MAAKKKAPAKKKSAKKPAAKKKSAAKKPARAKAKKPVAKKAKTRPHTLTESAGVIYSDVRRSLRGGLISRLLGS